MKYMVTGYNGQILALLKQRSAQVQEIIKINGLKFIEDELNKMYANKKWTLRLQFKDVKPILLLILRSAQIVEQGIF